MRIYTTFLLILAVQVASAQVSGKVTDESGSPVPFATVVLLIAADSAMAGGAMTAADGSYRVEGVRAGTFVQRISSVGYKTWTSSVLTWTDDNGNVSANINVNLGVQVLHPDTQQLGEVQVNAKRQLIENRTDGVVINVENSVMTKGSTALQLLERSPGVKIDLQNNTMELNGKNGVMVMLNNKLIRMPVEQLVSFLQGMSANDIVKIELLTTPPSGFDAEGSAGLINIVTRKPSKLGTTGSIVLSGGAGYKEKAMIGINLNRVKDKTTLYGSYTFSRDRSSNYFYAIGSELEPMLGGYAASEFMSRATAAQNSHNALAGLDLQLSQKTKAGISGNFNSSVSAIRMHNDGHYLVENDSVYTLTAESNSKNKWSSIIANGYIEHQLSDHRTINVDLDFLHYDNDYPTEASNSFLSSTGRQAGANDTLFSPLSKAISRTAINVGVAKADHKHTLNNDWKFMTGIKGTFTQTTGRSAISNLVEGSYVTRPASINNMRMHEQVAAVYASLEGQVDASLHFTGGLRYEYSDTQIEDAVTSETTANRRLSKLFPSLTISKELNSKTRLNFSYSKRISRPTYRDLTSFVTPNGPTSVNTGNPLLKPTITQSVNLGFQYSGYNFSVLLSRDEYPIARNQIVYTEDKTQMAVSPQNLTFQNNLTFQTSIPIHIGNWWDMTYTAVGGWRKFSLNYTPVPATRTYFAYTGQIMQTFRLPAALAIEISGYYNSNGYNGSRKTVGFGVLNAGIKKDFNKGGTLQLAFTDIFRSGAIKSYFGKLTEEAFDLRTQVAFHPESSIYHTVRLTYSKTFGVSVKPNQRKGNTGSQSERDRIEN
ncbi:MAG TPA: outer membrane beta-barrel family protein [Chryseolinea sp.]|nr:outer membrane beta-barrel family protein [Chryseolinea sp.]